MIASEGEHDDNYDNDYDEHDSTKVSLDGRAQRARRKSLSSGLHIYARMRRSCGSLKKIVDQNYARYVFTRSLGRPLGVITKKSKGKILF